MLFRKQINTEIFSSLKEKNFAIFWSGQGISFIGSWMQMMAQSWLIYDLFSSKILLGVFNGVSGLPLLLLTPIGGLFADRFNRKKLLFTVQIIFAVLYFLFGLMVSLKFTSFSLLVFIGFLTGLFNAIDIPARQAIVVNLVEKKYLGNAIALNSLGINIARILGPALAGYLIGTIGVTSCFYINAASFIPAAITLFLLKGDFRSKEANDISIKIALLKGAQYIQDNKKVLFSLILIAFSSTFVMPFVILMPVFAKDVLNAGPQGLGILMAFSGMGALIGAATLAQLSRKIDYEKFVIINIFVVSFSLILFSFSTIFAFSCLTLAFLGWGIVSLAASISTIIQREVPNELQGRVMSYYSMAFMGFMPIGAFQAGILSHFVGAEMTLTIGGVVCLIPALLMAIGYRKNK